MEELVIKTNIYESSGSHSFNKMLERYFTRDGICPRLRLLAYIRLIEYTPERNPRDWNIIPLGSPKLENALENFILLLSHMSPKQIQMEFEMMCRHKTIIIHVTNEDTEFKIKFFISSQKQLYPINDEKLPSKLNLSQVKYIVAR